MPCTCPVLTGGATYICASQDALNYGDHDGAANIEVRLAEDGSFVAVAKRAIEQGEEVRLCMR